MPPDHREFDLIVFGASGLTGRYAVEELAHTVAKSPEIKWAVAGGSEEKLKDTLAIVQEYLSMEDIEIKDIQIILADAGDPTSIYQMCKRTKLLLNCVGPYNFFGGEKIVSTCIECKTHCIDISAEIKYLDAVLVNHFEHAKENGVYIIEACGFGSLPADYGVSLLMKKFPGGLNSVEYFAEFGEGPSGKPVGFGTFSSIVSSLWDYLLPYKFEKEAEEKILKKTDTKSKLHTNKNYDFRDLWLTYKEGFWCIKYYGPDERAVKRSQLIRARDSNAVEQIEFQGHVKLPSLYEALWYIFFLLVSLILSISSPGRTLLRKNPSFFSSGLFSKGGPTRQQIKESFTKMTFYAKGWKEKVSDPEKQFEKPNKKIKLTILGPEVAYALTTMCMVQAAVTVLQDSDKLPFQGGVYTPGVAFENTRLQERLEKRGIAFTYK